MRYILTTLTLALLTACSGGGDADTSALTNEERVTRAPLATVDFGDDSSEWSNDGECDDPRFRGPGMTNTPLLTEDTKADATDCRSAYENGDLMLIE